MPLSISIKPFDLILYDSKTTCSSGVIRSVNKVAITPTKKIITKTVDIVNLRKRVIEDIAKRCKHNGAIVPMKRPKKEDRTKYRQPGFYELKPYGFEYRSLPANDAVMKALPEIVGKAFELLDSLNTWD
jgi:hypothetical protein